MPALRKVDGDQMKFKEGIVLSVSSYEFRYWAIFAGGVQVAWLLGFVSVSAVVVSFVSCAIGGCLMGERIRREFGSR